MIRFYGKFPVPPLTLLMVVVTVVDPFNLVATSRLLPTFKAKKLPWLRVSQSLRGVSR